MALIDFVVLEYGFVLKYGKKHHKLISTSGASMPVPHKHPHLSPGVVETICKFLKQEGIKDKTIAKYIL